jgi:hypothetical protein
VAFVRRGLAFSQVAVGEPEVSASARAVSVATHDVVPLEESLRRVGAAGVSPQVELMLGLPIGPALAVVRRPRAALRYYLGFGRPGLPYPVTAVLRRPRLAGLLVQGLARGARNQRIQQEAALGGSRPEGARL